MEVSGTMPSLPEVVSYREYEEQRDSCLPPTSLHEGRPYTARFMAADSSRSTETYAYDSLAIVTKIQHLGMYSIIGARIRDYSSFQDVEIGINQLGIAFNHEPLPEDLEFIPYKAEYGYFIEQAGGIGGGTVADHETVGIHSPEELLALAR